MKSEQKDFDPELNPSKNEMHGQTPGQTSGQTMDRRRFLRYAAGVGAIAGFGPGAFALAQQDAPADGQANDRAAATDARLPDGTVYVSWEQPLRFSKTYYVDNNSGSADDNGPGTKARPFRTINKAAQLLQPGERVVIASGTYRECVRPARGGTGPAQIISYEAAPGAKVFIKGSEVLDSGWEKESIPVGFRFNPSQTGPGESVTAWRHELTGAMFPDAYQPFALASVSGNWEWLNTKEVDMGPYFRRRGLVFVDGKPLEPMEQLRELAAAHLQPNPVFDKPPVAHDGLPPRRRPGPLMQEIGGSPDARFYVEKSGEAIHIRLPQGSPDGHLIEVTTREHVFAPLQNGLAFIRIKGITFQHAGNAYPFPQHGLITAAGGNHWIIEDNTIEWANGMGLDIANNGGDMRIPHAGTSHIIRRNAVRYCGVEGIGGMGTVDTVVEDNLLEWCGWADAEREFESAGAKFHRAHNLLFRRNVVRHMRHANGIWIDVGNVNCRITSNIFADTLTISAAVNLEMSVAPNQVDNNIIWDVRNAEPGTPGRGGCAGSGMFFNADNQLTIAQNLIGRCDNSGIHPILRPDRARSGTDTGNNIDNNIFAQCGKSAIVFLNKNNQSDGNLFVSMPDKFLGFFTGDVNGIGDQKHWFDLTAWRATYGWDMNGAMADMQIDLDADSLELTMSSKEPLPKVKIFDHIDTDIFGHVTGGTRAPGPIANPSAKRTWRVDPRRAV